MGKVFFLPSIKEINAISCLSFLQLTLLSLVVNVRRSGPDMRWLISCPFSWAQIYPLCISQWNISVCVWQYECFGPCLCPWIIACFFVSICLHAHFSMCSQLDMSLFLIYWKLFLEWPSKSHAVQCSAVVCVRPPVWFRLSGESPGTHQWPSPAYRAPQFEDDSLMGQIWRHCGREEVT